MASSAIFLTKILLIIASTSGFKIESLIQAPRFSSDSRSSSPTSLSPVDYRNQPIAGYPKVPPKNAHESGGSEDDLFPPFEDSCCKTQYFRRSVDDDKVDPKTGYPLVAQESWKYAGGDEESLQPPPEDTSKKEETLDHKMGYPLRTQYNWKDSRGDRDIIAQPLEDFKENFRENENVNLKTDYPLKANSNWEDARGSGDFLKLPHEDLSERFDQPAVDPETGYPLIAKEGWKDAGGDEEILELPLEEFGTAVDPKTGYPLVAQPSWKDAGGDGDILELPLEYDQTDAAFDPKTSRPLTAQPLWKNAGGDEHILQFPLEDRTPVDSKTGYPLVAQLSWKDAGGDGDILQLPLPSEEVDSKTGHPLVNQGEWKFGGDGDIMESPLQQSVAGQVQSRSGGEYHVIEVFKLTELQPPLLDKNFPNAFSNSFTTPGPSQEKLTFLDKRDSPESQQRLSSSNRPTESTYTYTGPDNVVVTVTRFISDKQDNQPDNSQKFAFGRIRGVQKQFSFHGDGVPAHFSTPVFLQPIHPGINKRHS